ncbi:MAG: hypothetical protein KatS3mg099_068 [Candidatus Parcubacteria bacterium]|nr:MAG: hypothetical protein KatS3mg099_068 [Candidatus Parcubacteria bacterium]
MTQSPSPDPSFAKKLQELRALAEENNRILRKMERRALWARVFRVAWWALLFAASFWLYLTLEPYFTQSLTLLRDAHGALEQWKQIPFQP